MDPDEQAIRRLHAHWIEAVNAADLPSLLGWMTEDVLLMSPGGPPIGREVFGEVFTAAHGELQVRCTSELVELEVLGDRAWSRCHDTLAVTPRAGGDTTRLAGDRLTIYRRGDDGHWRLARDAHTLTPVAPGEAAPGR